MRFILRFVVSGVAIWLTSLLLSGVDLETDGTWQNTLLVVAVVALVFTAVNTIVKPLVRVVSIPFYILTLGLFFLVVNALMLLLTSWLSGLLGFGLEVDGFLTAVLAALVISAISLVLNLVLPTGERDTRR